MKRRIKINTLVKMLNDKGYPTDRMALLRAEKAGRLPFSFHKTLGGHRFIFKGEFQKVLDLLQKQQNGNI